MEKLSVERTLIKAKSLSKKGEINNAIKLFQSVLVKFPKNIRAQEALQNLTETHDVTNNKNIPQLELDNLINLYQGEKIKTFLSEAEKVLKQYPDAFMVWNLLGIVEAKIGRVCEATKAFKKVVELNPSFTEGYNNLGNILNEQGQFDEAIVSFENALSIKPELAEPHNNIGNIFKNQGKFQNAIDSYKKAIFMRPNYTDAYNNMGVAYQNIGQLYNAVDAFKKAILLEPNYTEAWNNIVYSMQAMKAKIPSIDKILLEFYNEKKLDSQEIAKYILRYRLNRAQGISKVFFNQLVVGLSKAKNISIKNPTYKNTSTPEKTILPQKIISLVHFGRSGSGLLHSLIDNHPEVSTLPSIYFSEYFDHSTWDKIIKNGWYNIVDNFISTYEVLFDAKSNVSIATIGKKRLYNIGFNEGMVNMGNHQNESLSVDKNLFRQELISLLDCYKELNSLIFFKLVHVAYERAIKNFNHKSLIFYHIHNPDTYAQLNFIQSDPNANWVMIVRDPIQSCESWIKHSFRHNDYQICALRICKMLIEIDNYAYKNQKSIGVRLEDLKNYPKKTMPALCQWMGIEENESLYEMTMQGKKWWGDPTSSDHLTDGMNPFGKISINRKIGSILSKNDQFILRTFFYPFSVRFGYYDNNLEQFKNDLQTIRPMIDQMFDFEKVIKERTSDETNNFMNSGSYVYLRSILKDRWNVLNEFHTYPNMIQPLKIN